MRFRFNVLPNWLTSTWPCRTTSKTEHSPHSSLTCTVVFASNMTSKVRCPARSMHFPRSIGIPMFGYMTTTCQTLHNRRSLNALGLWSLTNVTTDVRSLVSLRRLNSLGGPLNITLTRRSSINLLDHSSVGYLEKTVHQYFPQKHDWNKPVHKETYRIVLIWSTRRSICLINAKASYVSDLRVAIPVPRPETNAQAFVQLEPAQDDELQTESFGVGFVPQNDVKCANVRMARSPSSQLVPGMSKVLLLLDEWAAVARPDR
ncbi:unnamed protein product [Toxocara canis]|uniref:Uncharacterized protein n=1 Tax=Toxocara canis TaxID=6265 RepID=A0A183V3Y3_TOXCA|nr:unnamed protein product [Toxocara canis]